MKIKKSTRPLLQWILLISVISCVIFFLYCAALFKELEPLINEAPHSQPSVLYSDVFLLKKNQNFESTFLFERLQDLKILLSENTEENGKRKISWQSRSFVYPEKILASDSPLQPKNGQTLTVFVENEKIDRLEIDHAEVETILLEPTAFAQIAGSNKSIRNYVKLPEIPTKLLQAIIAIEDQRFLEHPGFDLRSLARAIWVNIRSRAFSQGGSTLTQQLIKNILGTRQKTFFRKFKELILAILFEARYSKDFILEKYLNEVYFGQIGTLEVHGVGEAAKFFYNKQLNQLSLAEIATIAGVIRGPQVYSPYRQIKKSLERKDTVLKKMFELQIISKSELETALREELHFAQPSTVNNKAPYFADFVKAQVLDQLSDHFSAEDLTADGLRIFTTLDLPLQRRADTAVASTVQELESRYKIIRPLRLEGLLLAAESKTGYIKALVGGRSYTETTFNRVLNMKRQVGSTFKPITYLAALLKGQDQDGNEYTPAYMVDDEPWTHHYGNKKKWSPKNYEKNYRGKITLREAFANSINIPMAKIGIDVGISNVIDLAHRLGIKEPLPNVPSLSLGTVELKALDLLQAYATLANRGIRTDLTAVKLIVDENGSPLAHFEQTSTEVVDKNHVDLLNTLLASVVKEGTAKSLAQFGYTKPAFGKTGTTNFSRDAWFAGFSEGLVAVTWTGFDELKVPDELNDGENIKFKSPAPLTGAGSALPSWAKFFTTVKPALAIEEEFSPEKNSQLKTLRIDKTTGLRARYNCPAEFVYDEWFISGTEPSKECTTH